MRFLQFTLIAAFTILLSVAFTSCKKNNSNAHLTVKMTDEPGDYDTVNIEILEVQMHFSNDDGKNDFWYIDNLVNFIPNTVYIYNRWGNEIMPFAMAKQLHFQELEHSFMNGRQTPLKMEYLIRRQLLERLSIL